jgi:hypothetical protein
MARLVHFQVTTRGGDELHMVYALDSDGELWFGRWNDEGGFLNWHRVNRPSSDIPIPFPE